jgi:hypothetical protein
MLLGTAVSRDSELQQRLALGEQWERWDGGSPHRWHMRLTEFCSVFNSATVHHKVGTMKVATIEVAGPAAYTPQVERIGFTTAEEHSDKPPEGKGPHYASPDVAQPVYFLFDSDSPASALVSFAVVPPPIVTADVGAPSGGSSGTSATPSRPASSASASLTAGPASTTDASASNSLPPPQYSTEPASLTIEHYKWKSPHTHESPCQLVTSNAQSAALRLRAGRQVYKIVPSAQSTYSVSVALPKSFGGVAKIAHEKEALEFFGGETIQTQQHAIRIGKLIGFMVRDHNRSFSHDCPPPPPHTRTHTRTHTFDTHTRTHTHARTPSIHQ